MHPALLNDSDPASALYGTLPTEREFNPRSRASLLQALLDKSKCPHCAASLLPNGTCSIETCREAHDRSWRAVIRRWFRLHRRVPA
jgi:hypothetical protein